MRELSFKDFCLPKPMLAADTAMTSSLAFRLNVEGTQRQQPERSPTRSVTSHHSVFGMLAMLRRTDLGNYHESPCKQSFGYDDSR